MRIAGFTGAEHQSGRMAKQLYNAQALHDYAGSFISLLLMCALDVLFAFPLPEAEWAWD